MSVSSSTDPVQSVKDILDNMAAGDWSNLGSTPDRIEFEWTSEPSEKFRNNRLGELAVYVGSPAVGSLTQHSPTTYLDRQVVQCNVLSGTEDDVISAATDIRDHFASTYWPDNAQKSTWHDIMPAEEDDRRGQGFHRSGFFSIGVQLVLVEKRDK